MELKDFSVLTILMLLLYCSCFCYTLDNNRPSRRINDELMMLASPLTDTEHMNKALDNILIPRVVGTTTHESVANYIVGEMENLGWAVERDQFKDKTPIFGQLDFQNIIARLNPKARRYLVLACHYDSKYERNYEFLGATDSAVPCAMMLNLAYVLKHHLNAAKYNNELSLLFIFFDGEEAFLKWSQTDSLYGSRHLAAKWENQISEVDPGTVTELDRIDVFVLLDLIGVSNQTFYNYFAKTSHLFARLSDIEDHLAGVGQLRKNSVWKYFINEDKFNLGIEDDHIPFLYRGVPILHIIPVPFPKVWHTASDNRTAIDLRTVEDLNKILRVFVIDFLSQPQAARQ